MQQVESKTVYMYVLVREDLSGSQIAVQSAHAVIEAIRAFAPGQNQEHPHLVLLSVKNEYELLKAYERLQHYGIQVAKFQEPDRNNEYTAIATEPLPADSKLRRKFSCYTLLNLNPTAKVSENETKAVCCACKGAKDE